MSRRGDRTAGGRPGAADGSVPPRPPKDALNALAVAGSRDALRRFARLAVVLAAITLALAVAAAVLAAVGGPGLATVLCLCFGVVCALILAQVAVGTVRAAVAMREFPWVPYHAVAHVPSSQRVKPRMEIAGGPGRRAVLVPAAGGPLVWAARDRKKATRQHPE